MSDTKELVKRNKILERRWKVTIILVIIFIITRPIALYLVKNFINKSAEEAIKNDYPLIDPARQFISQENFITNVQPLREYLNELSEKYPNSLSIYYEQLNSGANIVVNKDLKLYVASLIKLPIAIVAVKQVEKGIWDWNTKFAIKSEDLDQDSGSVYKNIMNFDPNNDVLTLEQLISAMLIDSDNTAKNILVNNLSKKDFNDFEQEVGFQDVFDENGHASAKEYSRVLRVLYTSSFLERKNSQKILELLDKAKFKNFLSRGVPADVTFPHKYGENANEKIFADTGIVYVPNKPYMITVIFKSKDVTEESVKFAEGLMKEISAKAYETSK